MAVDVKAVLKRYDRLWQQQGTTRAMWQDLADYILPRKSNITVRRTPGSKQTMKVFDSTAIHANELLAASMQGALTSATVKWFRLKTRMQALNDVQAVALFLDESADHVYLAFQQSNLNSELQEVYLDLGCFGIGALMLEEKDPQAEKFSGFRFHALQVGTFVVAENADGLVDTLMREITMSARAAFTRWGSKVGDKIARMAQDKPDESVTILHAVYPRRGARGKAAKAKPFASVYIDKDGQHLIHESGYDDFPFMVPRWTKTSGEVYGRGPGHTALPDVKTLNKAVELTLKAWTKALDPVILARQDGVLGDVKLTPGAVNTVTDLEALSVLESKARFDVGEIKEADLKTSIKDIFFNNQLQLPEKQYMTATEVERAYEMMHRVLGPTLGRLEAELLSPLIERAFAIMLRRGALPAIPDELAESELDIEYEGPLARAQRASDVQAIERTLGLALPIVQVSPESLDVLDLDEAMRYIAQRNGLPPQLIRSPQAIQDMRKSRLQAQQQQRQLEEAGMLAEGAGRVAPLIKAMREPEEAQAA